MAQNTGAGQHFNTDNLVGSRMFIGTTTPSYPVTGDVWIDNSLATTGIQGDQGLQGTQGTTGAQGAQGLQGTQGSTYTAPTIGTTTISSGSTVSTISGVALAYPFENIYINAVALTTSGYTAYVSTNTSVHYLTSNATGNGTLNISYASGTTLNSIMTTGETMTFVLLVTNGSTAYYPNAYQVDGTTSGVTVKWSGGTAPSSGNASGVDMYQFNVLKTGSAAFTVFASGPIKYA